MIELLMQLCDLLLPLVNDLAQRCQLVLALVDDSVNMVLRLVLHLVHLRMKGVVVSRKTPPVLPLNRGKKEIRTVSIVKVLP